MGVRSTYAVVCFALLLGSKALAESHDSEDICSSDAFPWLNDAGGIDAISSGKIITCGG